MSHNYPPVSKNPRIGQKWLSSQSLQVVPGCRSATWVLSGSCFRPLWWMRDIVRRWHDHGTLGRKSMSLSDWETMWFGLEEKYMPIWVNVPTLWINYQMKKRNLFFLANFVLLSLLECYLPAWAWGPVQRKLREMNEPSAPSPSARLMRNPIVIVPHLQPSSLLCCLLVESELPSAGKHQDLALAQGGQGRHGSFP